MNLSSKTTFYLKFIHPLMLGLVLLYCLYDARHPAIINGLAVSVSVAVMGLLFGLCGRIKKVATCEDGTMLIVSNFRRECLVKKADIREVKVQGPKKRFVKLRLGKRCTFGDEIVFVPPLSVLVRGNKYIREFVCHHTVVGHDQNGTSFAPHPQ
jgi:hypothetical protein